MRLAGGNGSDYGASIAVDGNGNALVTGHTSGLFPVTADALQFLSEGGPYDAFITKLAPAGGGASDLLYSTYLGGENDDYGEGIAVDGIGNVYIAGYTQSVRFPTTRKVLKSWISRGDPTDAFVARIVFAQASDVGVAGGGFNTTGRVVLSRCGFPCNIDVKIKVKNYGDITTDVAFNVASDAPGVADPLAGCSGTVTALPPGGTETVTGCIIYYNSLGNPTLSLTVSPDVGTDIDPSNNVAEKTVKVLQ